ncbi:MAG TPA: acetyl-CoA carboxylase biotin carboxylase subunit [Candidatus Binataceae bacterium]|nr:acetyl-CoA carboxylase biotin carboxylase subunit [Candidatus Binataceae bacterium]
MAIRKLLIANRGEIAVRILRAARELGIATVQVVSKADHDMLAARLADEVVEIGPPPAAKSYLNRDAILDAARRTGADAIHPGYGFLSENADFAAAVEQAGLVFVGPRSQTIRLMGDKAAAREAAAKAGVPTVPGSAGRVEEGEALDQAGAIGFPVMIKAAAGGGGKGLRFVEHEKDLASSVRTVASEAKASFGDGRFYVEKFVNKPRHIEVQVFADHKGNTVHVFERECSIQRRHQKVVEESPSPFVTPEMRQKMGEVAVRAAKAVNYLGAGTIEFLVDADRNFYFLEMNTRIQVEHPVTELVTGIDLVKTQIEVAAGAPLPFKQSDLSQKGWAIECRVYAEDPDQGFAPAPGKIETLRLPEGPGVRSDCGVYEGYEVPVYYDPMISKLATWGRDRTEAIDRMRRALGEFAIAGALVTNLDFHRWIVNHPRFQKGDFDTSFIAQEFPPAAEKATQDPIRAAAILLAAAATHAEGNSSSRRTIETGRAAAQWKTAGRYDSLRR